MLPKTLAAIGLGSAFALASFAAAAQTGYGVSNHAPSTSTFGRGTTPTRPRNGREPARLMSGATPSPRTITLTRIMIGEGFACSQSDAYWRQRTIGVA